MYEFSLNIKIKTIFCRDKEKNGARSKHKLEINSKNRNIKANKTVQEMFLVKNKPNTIKVGNNVGKVVHFCLFLGILNG